MIDITRHCFTCDTLKKVQILCTDAPSEFWVGCVVCRTMVKIAVPSKGDFNHYHNTTSTNNYDLCVWVGNS